MKLSAVTICIHYTDYLRCIAANRKHFDRWVIVTVADDRETISFCRDEGMEYHVSQTLQPCQLGFDAAYNKSPALNEGLDLLGDDGWAAVIDSDVYLPSSFRERLEAIDPDPACLYGLAGRRICHSYEEFEALRTREPWEASLQRNLTVIGFFNLFHLSHPASRYPARGNPRNRSGHDDWGFQLQFGERQRKFLPMTCLHVGPAARNWGGRRSAVFVHEARAADSGQGRLVSAKMRAALGDARHRLRRAVLLGAGDGQLAAELADIYRAVDVIDAERPVRPPRPDPESERDSRWREERLQSRIAGRAGIALRGPHTTSAIAEIPDGTVDLLCIAFEPAWDTLVTFLPRWLSKLAPGARISGWHFGHQCSSEVTHAVSLLFGPPEAVFSDSGWIAPASAFVGAPPAESGGEEGVVILCRNAADAENAVVTLHSLREHWRASVRVVNVGDDIPALSLAALSYGAEAIDIPVSEEKLERRAAEFFALEACRFARAVLIPAGAVVMAPIDELFHSLSSETPWIVPGGRKPRVILGCLVQHACLREACSREIARSMNALAKGGNALGPCRGLAFDPQSIPAPATPFSGSQVIRWGPVDPESPDLAEADESDPAMLAAEAWFRCEDETLRRAATPLRIGSGHTLVIPVTLRTAGSFLRNLVTWRPNQSAPAIAVLIGLDDEADAIVAEAIDGSFRVARTAASEPADADAALAAAVQVALPHLNTESMIILSPEAFSLPGAELFTEPHWSGCGAAASGWAFTRTSKALADLGARLGSDAETAAAAPVVRYLRLNGPAVLLQAELADRAAAAWRAGESTAMRLDHAVTLTAIQQNLPLETLNLRARGWKAPPSSVPAPSRPAPPSP